MLVWISAICVANCWGQKTMSSQKKEKDGYIPHMHEQTGNKSVVTNGSIILKQQVQARDITVNRAKLSYITK